MSSRSPCVMIALVLLLCYQPATAVRMESRANPIRRVVKMLQSMSTKVEEEGEKEKELFEKYMCYCKTSGTDLSDGIAASEAKVPELTSAIEESTATKAQLTQDLKDHKKTREDAKASLEEAAALREKEAAEFAKVAEESGANTKALGKAIEALEKGMGASFLQSRDSEGFRRLIVNAPESSSFDKEAVMAFISEASSVGSGYAPQSGEIVGMLKQMLETMDKDFADAKAAEEEAIANYEALVAAKKKEIAASTKAIEEKSVRLGKVSVKIAEMSNDLEDTSEALAEDKKFLADLEKNCDTKKSEWDKIEKLRSEEKIAIAETIKILNDDDALELFKKTLPSPSLVQVAETAASRRQRALSALQGARAHKRPEVDFLALALTGKKVSFDKVFVLIDELVETLKKEQVDDASAKEHCEKQFDLTEDKEKELTKQISDVEAAIEDTKESLAKVVEEIEALTKSLAALDKSVKEATETRKEEHTEYTDLMASDSAAKELLGLAKNRLNKFYNPKLHKTTPPPKMSDEEEIAVNFGVEAAPTNPPSLLQVQSSADAKPPPPPESFGPYSKKGEESNGVMAMLDMLVADLDKEMTEAEAEEKNAQAEYEQFMADAADKRAQDSKTLTDKQAAKADMESELDSSKDSKKALSKKLQTTKEYMASLHGECDWLLKNFDLRKSARAEEMDSLANAKAVLSGADYSFAQLSQQVHRLLRGSM
eukprot:CAMPEP_0178398790 /NCGR_PEP_ID=MMETSP0689_2-20121128/14951_1 /TAXON_ID=160604 /ORGANISM="Amphidinium massartii, Strain CS-259" /LENGTH=712 /DNA_ID=CAMNT_0020019557 /DNA_START=23 /DNA_END=2161 /DNA_ORIENTATION=+